MLPDTLPKIVWGESSTSISEMDREHSTTEWSAMEMHDSLTTSTESTKSLRRGVSRGGEQQPGSSWIGLQLLKFR